MMQNTKNSGGNQPLNDTTVEYIEAGFGHILTNGQAFAQGISQLK